MDFSIWEITFHTLFVDFSSIFSSFVYACMSDQYLLAHFYTPKTSCCVNCDGKVYASILICFVVCLVYWMCVLMCVASDGNLNEAIRWNDFETFTNWFSKVICLSRRDATDEKWKSSWWCDQSALK